MRICNFCRLHILESGSTWGMHRGSFADYCASETEHCVFCTKLLAVLNTKDLKPGYLVYRWTIRKAAKIREMPDSYTIAFREIPSSVVGKPKSTAGLPSVTFHMVREIDVPEAPSESSNVAGETSSIECMEQLQRWATICDQGHSEKCHPCLGSDRDVPTRLIDVGDPSTGSLPDRLKLVETNSMTDNRYVTLSHCWGKEKNFLTLHKKNLDEYKKDGIPWTEICQNHNFRDAIEVTRHLKVRFIWIDSLCIIQDGDGGEDWNNEAPRMHSVYRNSYCNIAASAAAHSKDGGLFRTRRATDIALARYPDNGEIPADSLLAGAWRIVPASLWDEDLLGQVLYGRGWVFQERMLAPRAIHFTNTQIFWDCPTHSACESLPRGIPRQLDHLAAVDRRWRAQLQKLRPSPTSDVTTTSENTQRQPEIPPEFWKIAVHKYTSCQLTHHSDKLLALWGIAKLVEDDLREPFVAGLWGKKFLLEQLAWAVVDPALSERPASLKATPEKPEPDWFPSWSWASVTGKVEVVEKPFHNPCYLATDHNGKDIEAVRGISKPTGGLPKIPKDQAIIKLQCHRGEGSLEQAEKGTSWAVKITGTGQSFVSIRAFPDVSPSDEDLLSACKFLILAAAQRTSNLQRDGTQIWGLGSQEMRRTVYSGFGLMVKDVKDERGPGYVERVGVVKFDKMPVKDWKVLCCACDQEDNVLSGKKGEKLVLV